MPEISLYRKYRPQNFLNLVGQEYIRETLLNAIKSDFISHAFLFTGPRGTGKTSTARLLAKAINCLSRMEDGNPCEKCDICKDIIAGRSIDLIEIDAASNRGIDEIRDLKEKINFAPTHAKKKVYIIDEVHMLTKEAFNALLKTLEEPPAHAHFILATTEIHKVPETIISRCQRFDFRRIDKSIIVERLKFIAEQEGITSEEQTLELIAQSSQGGLRDAIGLFEQLINDKKLDLKAVKEKLGLSGTQTLDDFYQNIKTGLRSEAIKQINSLYFKGIDLTQFNKDFLEFLREKLLKKISKGSSNTDLIMQYIEVFLEAHHQLKSSVIPQLPLEIAIIKSTRIPADTTLNNKIVQIEPASKRSSGLKNLPVEKPAQGNSALKIADPEIQTETGQNSKINLSLKDIQDGISRVFDHIKLPVAKISFKQGRPSSFENGILKMNFSSKMHMEKIKEAANKASVEDAFKHVFGVEIKVMEEFKSISLEPSIIKKEVAQPENIIESKPAENVSENDIMNIFEGAEMMEE